MHASGGPMLYGPSLSFTARQQLKEARLREKDPHSNIGRELNDNDNNLRKTKATNDFCFISRGSPAIWLTSWHSRLHCTSPILLLSLELN